jgi:hypothetical protein
MHFPIDSYAGAALGETVGRIVLGLCTDGAKPVRRIDYAAVHSDFTVAAFRPDLWRSDQAQHLPETGLARGDALPTIARSELFEWLWDKAAAEFRLS